MEAAMSRFFKASKHQGSGIGTRDDDVSVHSHDGSEGSHRTSLRGGPQLLRSPVLRRPSVDIPPGESCSLPNSSILHTNPKSGPVPLPLPSPLPSPPSQGPSHHNADDSRRSSGKFSDDSRSSGNSSNELDSRRSSSNFANELSTHKTRPSNYSSEEMPRPSYVHAQFSPNIDLFRHGTDDFLVTPKLTLRTERGEGSGSSHGNSAPNLLRSPQGSVLQKSMWFPSPTSDYPQHTSGGQLSSSINGFTHPESSVDRRSTVETNQINGQNSTLSRSTFYPLPRPLNMSSSMIAASPPQSPRAAPLSPRAGPFSPHLAPLSPRAAQVSSRPASLSPRAVPQSPRKTDSEASAPKWHKGHLLGSGAFGRVYKGIHSETGEFCAIKEVPFVRDDPKARESARQLAQEIAFLSNAKHSNIVQYKGSELVGDSLYIYLEFISGGSLYRVFQEFDILEEQVIRRYTRQILNGLEFLHKRNIVHRDIKCANILVDQDGVVKLADFGLAKYIREQGVPFSMKGSPYWMAPEVIMQKNTGYEYAVDIWGLGCSVIEMATGKPPWSELEGVVAMFKVTRGELPFIPQSLSAEAHSFIKLCLQKNPADRPSATQLLDHPFVQIENGYCDTMVHAFEVLDTLDLEDMQMLSHQSLSEKQQSSLSCPSSPRSSYRDHNSLYPTRSGGFLTPPRGGYRHSPFH